MKKTLAILLALMMILSLALVSCNKKPDETKQTDDDFGFNFEDPTETPTGNATENGSDKATEDSGGNTESNFTAASGTAYILHPVKVRTTPKMSSKETVGVAGWGDAVELVESNGTWTKIKFTAENGTTKEGYILDELLTADKAQVTLVSLETPAKAAISGLGKKEDGTPYTLNVRTTPWNCSKSEEYENVNVLANISNEEYSVKDGDEVEKLGATEDGKWVYIKFTKQIDGKDVVEYGWCSVDFVTVEGEEVVDPGENPDAPPVIEPIL